MLQVYKYSYIFAIVGSFVAVESRFMCFLEADQAYHKLVLVGVVTSSFKADIT